VATAAAPLPCVSRALLTEMLRSSQPRDTPPAGGNRPGGQHGGPEAPAWKTPPPWSPRAQFPPGRQRPRQQRRQQRQHYWLKDQAGASRLEQQDQQPGQPLLRSHSIAFPVQASSSFATAAALPGQLRRCRRPSQLSSPVPAAGATRSALRVSVLPPHPMLPRPARTTAPGASRRPLTPECHHRPKQSSAAMAATRVGPREGAADVAGSSPAALIGCGSVCCR